jgi:molybdate transport system ATP-binding protein
VFQEASLFPHLSVLGNLRYGMQRSGSTHAARLEQAIALLGIHHLLARKPDRLSGGERQRVGIARALAVHPRLLLMDEPLAALDQKRKNEILPYLERLHDELSMPVLYVSHSIDEVARLADTLVLLEDGRVRALGPLAEVIPRLDLPLSQGDDAGVVISATVALHDTQWGLSRVDFAGGSLWVGLIDKPPGAVVRVRVPARDVSIALIEPAATSILNILPASVVAIEHDEHGRSLVRLQVGEVPLLARITRRSATRLGLAPGSPVVAQIKGVALLG